MPTATPSTITPPRPRPSTSAPHAATQGRAATTPRQSVAFAQFVDSNRHLFVDYVQRRLEGRHAGAAEDALQEGLIKIWNEWEHWPTDETERIRFARQALRLAAFDAIRRRTGRDDSPRAGEINVDFTALNYANLDSPAAEGLIQDLGRAIAEQSMVKDQLGYLERASLIAAIATLTDLEQRVLFMTARGDDCKQIAADLGVSHQQTREALMRARRLCRMLIEHADGQKVAEKEAKLLWQYADGQLSGKRARELKRHVEHCTACQRLLGLEESIATNGALVILPIPVLLLAAGKTLAGGGGAAATAGAGGSGGAASGAGVGAQLGGTILAPAAPSTTFGSVLAGITAKVAVGLAGLATTASIAGVYKLAHDRQSTPHHTLSAQVAPRATKPHDAILTHPAGAPAPTAHRRKTAVKRAPKQRVRRRPPAAHPAVTAPARTAPAAQPTAPPTVPPRATAAATNPQPSASGGEFVLGRR